MPPSRRSLRTFWQNHQDLGQREYLKATAQETLQTLPNLLQELNTSRDARRSSKYSFESLPRQHPELCPFYPRPATIRVVRDDTLNAAIRLLQSVQDDDNGQSNLRPAVVNFANRHSPGGGWLKGAMAQEEAICYRSSLALSLNGKRHYPLATNEALYSPYVMIMRGDLDSGHHILSTSARDLPIVSVLTVAAIHQPKIRKFLVSHKTDRDTMNDNDNDNSGSEESDIEDSGLDGNGGNENGDEAQFSDSRSERFEKRVFARDKDRDLTKAKMRLALRMAVFHRHRLLVLGAFGCGVYENPPEDVAHCWLEVLREDEFSGNWWRKVWFAVYDPNDEGNFAVFHRVLSGKQV